MKQLNSLTCSIFLLLISFHAISEVNLRLTMKDGHMFFTAENWSHMKSTADITMCFDETNGIEIGEYVNNKFVKADRGAQVTFPCMINKPKAIEPYQIVGTFAGNILIENVYNLSPRKNRIVFRICVNKVCNYSNELLQI